MELNNNADIPQEPDRHTDIFRAFEANLDNAQATTYNALTDAMAAEQAIRDEFPQGQDKTDSYAQQAPQEVSPFADEDLSFLDGLEDTPEPFVSIPDKPDLMAAAEAAAQVAIEYPFPEFLKEPIKALFDPAQSPLTIIEQDDGTASVSMYQPGMLQSRIITASLTAEGELRMDHVSFPGEGENTSWLTAQVPTHISRTIGRRGFFLNGMHARLESEDTTGDSFMQEDTLQQLGWLSEADRSDRPTYDLFSGDPIHQGHFPDTGEYTPLPNPGKVQQMLLLIKGNHAAQL